ncbi:homoserine O-acetyltransferase, partial [mine drainage metagenome]
LSPPAHAAASPEDPRDGWWQRMIGPGLALDTDRYFVVCVNSLGSCFGSTGPASVDPGTGQPYRLTFPDLSIEDIARAGHELVHTLGILRLDTVMGPSLGGMVVLAYAALFPGGARRLVSISGPRPHRPSRSRCARFNAMRSPPTPTGATANTAASGRRPPACAWRASSAR